MSVVSDQHDAPVGTLALIGHPANDIRIIKLGTGWAYVSNGEPVDDEGFRAGWDDVPAQPSSAGLKRAIEERDEAKSLLAECRRDLRDAAAFSQEALEERDVVRGRFERLGEVLELVKDQRDALRVFANAVADLEADMGSGVNPDQIVDLNALIAGAHATWIVQLRWPTPALD